MKNKGLGVFSSACEKLTGASHHLFTRKSTTTSMSCHCLCGAPVLDAVGTLKGSSLMRCVLFALFLVAAGATVSAADSYTDAVSAVHRDDYDLAARLFRPLAEQGHAGAQSFLGVLYANGQGVPQNVIRAYMWLTVAVAGSRGDDVKTATMNQTTVASDMTTAQIEQAQEMAWRCQASQFLQCEMKESAP